MCVNTQFQICFSLLLILHVRNIYTFPINYTMSVESIKFKLNLYVSYFQIVICSLLTCTLYVNVFLTLCANTYKRGGGGGNNDNKKELKRIRKINFSKSSREIKRYKIFNGNSCITIVYYYRWIFIARAFQRGATLHGQVPSIIRFLLDSYIQPQ